MKLTYVSVISWFVMAAICGPALAYGQANSTALRFSADGQYVLVPFHSQLDVSGDLTIEAWVKPEESILSSGYSSIVSKQLNGTGYMLATNMVGPEPGFKAEVHGNQVTSGSQPAVDGWQHVAAVWSNSELKIYVNGQFDGVINTGNPIPNSLPLWIGSSPFGDNTNWRGSIDEVRLWSVARTQAEIQSSMDQYLCGDERGLRAYWSFDEGQGNLLHDTFGPNNGFVVGPSWADGVDLIRLPGCPRNVNDALQIGSVQTGFTPPPVSPQPEAPAGIFSIVTSFTNKSSSDICNPFFAVSELSPGKLRLLRVGVNGQQIQGIDGEQISHPAVVLGAGGTAQFRFDIGLPSLNAFTFFVNVWGTLQPQGSPCPNR
jgi:hypothetical protein